MARHTTFRIGGPADYYAVATTAGQLAALADAGLAAGLPVTILGGGSNVLVADAGIRGLVIANQARGHGVQDDDPHCLVADAGVLMAGLARWAIRNGLSGLEWAVSVPGTVGGAVIGNAGAHGSDTAAHLAWAAVHYPGRGTETLTGEALAYTYRSSLLKRQLAEGPAAGPVVLSAAFKMAAGDATELAARADGYLARRRASQPVEPSAGSIFRNPPGDYAGRLVESVGLKGHVIGGAQISPRHANFIINIGGAAAADVVALMDLMRRRVYEASGHALVPEILFIGAWASQPPLEALPGE
ncbi:MAG: UDP-N-acetylenolpyruvoylglucosamine reductase [Chloroflexi bacterium ADurb.Bin325]|nr:MAG: UDP-N-acetylenolpyruvoylglucosamine reductase [Chloroflexi bacterium ADurb.Bin325]